MKQHWNKLYKEGRKFSPVSEILLDDLQLKGESVLDVGCGTGELMGQLQNRGFDVSGIDLSDYSADMVGDFMKTDLAVYDIIFANKVIAFNDIDKFLDKVKKHLRPNGIFVCITPILLNKYSYDERLKSISVDYQTLTSAMKKRFKVKEVNRNYFERLGVELTVVGFNEK